MLAEGSPVGQILLAVAVVREGNQVGQILLAVAVVREGNQVGQGPPVVREGSLVMRAKEDVLLHLGSQVPLQIYLLAV